MVNKEIKKIIDLVEENNQKNNAEIVGNLLAIGLKLDRLGLLEQQNEMFRLENIDLSIQNDKLKEEINELSKDELCFEKRCDKLEKAIELLKEKFVIKFEFIPQYNYVRVCIQDSVDEISFVISLDTHKEQYDLLKEVLGND